jgi:rhomboid family GlyGly-CTERM serine protease
MADDRFHFFCASNNKWLFCTAVAVAAFILSYWPQGLLLFRYERMAISSGQLWRLVSAHLVHVNTSHLLLNLGGLLLICELLWSRLPIRHGIGLLASGAAGIDGLLWWLHPEMAWYAGLSGVLHGLWAGCALATCLPLTPATADYHQTATADPVADNAQQSISRWIGIGGLLFLLVKLFLEARHGASPDLEKMIGAPVVSIAHLYGALTGCAYVLLWRGGGRLLQKFTRHSVFD